MIFVSHIYNGDYTDLWGVTLAMVLAQASHRVLMAQIEALGKDLKQQRERSEREAKRQRSSSAAKTAKPAGGRGGEGAEGAARSPAVQSLPSVRKISIRLGSLSRVPPAAMSSPSLSTLHLNANPSGSHQQSDMGVKRSEDEEDDEFAGRSLVSLRAGPAMVKAM